MEHQEVILILKQSGAESIQEAVSCLVRTLLRTNPQYQKEKIECKTHPHTTVIQMGKTEKTSILTLKQFGVDLEKAKEDPLLRLVDTWAMDTTLQVHIKAFEKKISSAFSELLAKALTLSPRYIGGEIEKDNPGKRFDYEFVDQPEELDLALQSYAEVCLSNSHYWYIRVVLKNAGKDFDNSQYRSPEEMDEAYAAIRPNQQELITIEKIRSMRKELKFEVLGHFSRGVLRAAPQALPFCFGYVLSHSPFKNDYQFSIKNLEGGLEVQLLPVNPIRMRATMTAIQHPNGFSFGEYFSSHREISDVDSESSITLSDDQGPELLLARSWIRQAVEMWRDFEYMIQHACSTSSNIQMPEGEVKNRFVLYLWVMGAIRAMSKQYVAFDENKLDREDEERYWGVGSGLLAPYVGVRQVAMRCSEDFFENHAIKASLGLIKSFNALEDMRKKIRHMLCIPEAFITAKLPAIFKRFDHLEDEPWSFDNLLTYMSVFSLGASLTSDVMGVGVKSPVDDLEDSFSSHLKRIIKYVKRHYIELSETLHGVEYNLPKKWFLRSLNHASTMFWKSDSFLADVWRLLEAVQPVIMIDTVIVPVHYMRPITEKNLAKAMRMATSLLVAHGPEIAEKPNDIFRSGGTIEAVLADLDGIVRSTYPQDTTLSTMVRVFPGTHLKS